jgi:hypothetical protein
MIIQQANPKSRWEWFQHYEYCFLINRRVKAVGYGMIMYDQGTTDEEFLIMEVKQCVDY